jgi:V8-like Glu-specific endopeptidase
MHNLEFSALSLNIAGFTCKTTPTISIRKTIMLHISKRPKKSPNLAKLALCAGTLAGLWHGSTTIAKSAIIGVDNRVTPSYEWMTSNSRQAIGRLEIQAADGLYYTCSFTVIGRNIGLTNTHCLRDSQGRGPRQIKAFALQHGNRVYASANVDLYWTALPKAPVTFADHTKDWAIVRFNNNMGNTTGWFGNAGYSNSVNNAGSSVAGQSTNLIGYSGGGTTPTGHFGCRLDRTTGGILMHNCDTLPGASGSSLHSSGRLVQSLHWGSFSYGGSTVNGSVPLERFMPAVQQLRNNGGASSSVPVP